MSKEDQFPTNFYKVSPEKKVEMMQDGYRFIAGQINDLGMNLSRLNRWIQVMPDLIEHGYCAKPTTNELNEMYELLSQAADFFSPRLMDQEERYQKLFMYLKSKEK